MAGDERRVVAFLGPEGSYTHQAALSAFASPVTVSPLPTIEAVFAAVQSRSNYRGVVPFENSSNGSVVFTLDLFADLCGKYPDILVCGEAYVAVRHCLLGHANTKSSLNAEPESNLESERPVTSSQATEPDATDSSNHVSNPASRSQVYDFSHISTLYSHPQAWGQCTAFLRTHLPHAFRIDVSSTSRAAELVANDTSGTSAALSSIIAADMFGVDVLAEGINDRVGNMTRFLVIRHRSEDDGGKEIAGKMGSEIEEGGSGGQGGDKKSLVTFTVSHSDPGALARCLSAFSSQGLNLTSINTRPSGVRNWNYVFFVEFQGGRKEGSGEGKGDGDCAVRKALGELGKVCSGWRWLGSWENRAPVGEV